MPITKCNNGKYRIGTGACIYDTEEKATEVWKAILAQGNYEVNNNKVSYDWDDTLKNNNKLITQFMTDRASGKQVYIITRRRKSGDNMDIVRFCNQVNLPDKNVYYTNGSYKWETIRHLGIGTHYDNNQTEISLINQYTSCKGVKV